MAPAQHIRNRNMSQQTDPSLTVKKLSETLCAKDYATSLKCLNDNEYDKTKCQDQFVAYKKCRQVEKGLRLEENSKKRLF